MNYKNYTKDQKESFWIILLLLSVAAAIFTGASLLFASHAVIAVLLSLSGLFLTGLAVTGYIVEFIDTQD